MLNAFAILGAVLLLLSGWACWRNARADVSGMSLPWLVLWHSRWVFGLALGVVGYSFSYWYESPTTDDVYRVHGWPFLSHAFDQRGYDFLGPMTGVALFLNFLAWGLLPQLLVWPLTWGRGRMGASCPDPCSE